MLRTFTLPARRWWAAAAVLMAALSLSGCGYNNFQTLDEQVKAA